MIAKRLSQLKDKFYKFGIDGYAIPKNDEFFSEYSQKDRLKTISNFTGSAGYAVILKKPILFLTSNEYMKSYDSFTVHSYAKHFKQPLFNIDNFKESDFKKNLKKIDQKIYKKYFNDYIKYPGTPNIASNKIFINYFKKIS